MNFDPDIIRLEPFGTVYNDDVCGNKSGNYCVNAPHNQIVSIGTRPNGTELVVARLFGNVQTYSYTEQDGFGDAVDIANINIDPGLAKEFGLTGIVVTDQYIFCAVTTLTDTTTIAKITRIDKNRVQTDIYTVSDPRINANAHNLHAGCTTMLRSKKTSTLFSVLLMPFGDLNKVNETCYNPDNDFGKLLMMDMDGNMISKEDYDTGYPNNMHLAYGNRNMFTIRQLPSTHDTQQRFVWGENGGSVQRACVFTLNKPEQRYNLQWSGIDDDSWTNMYDTVTGSQAVLYHGEDSSGIWVEPLNHDSYAVLKYFPKQYVKSGNSLVLHSYMSKGKQRSRCVNVELIQNLNTAPQPAGYAILKTIIWSENDFVSSPMALALLPDGTFVVSDVFTGNLYHGTFIGHIDEINSEQENSEQENSEQENSEQDNNVKPEEILIVSTNNNNNNSSTTYMVLFWTLFVISITLFILVFLFAFRVL